MYTKQMIEERWNDILEYIRTEFAVPDVSFRTWILPLKIYDTEDNILTLIVDDTIINSNNLGFIQNRYSTYIKVAIAEILNEDYELNFVLRSQIKKMENEKKAVLNSSTPGRARYLNPQYTFDNFVVGDNNNTAHAAALAVAEAPGESFNPLYIYGGPGLGKTHLMYSIANYILDMDPSKKVLYVTSETFTNDLVKAIQSGNTASEEFREKYRNNDVFLIDDIQFLINKERTQEEFFHTFNEMKDSGRQVIISSDKPPRELRTLDERLRSRFEWGLTVDIQPPAFETRMAILRKKNESSKIIISDEILNYIATNIKSNIRELEGALTKIIAYGRLQKKEITLSLTQEALKDIISPDSKKTVTLDLILDVVAEHYEITSSQIISSNKSRNIAYPRQIAMYLCKELTPLSLDEIGKSIGGRDHSTVHYAFKKVSSDYRSDETIRSTIELLKNKINP